MRNNILYKRETNEAQILDCTKGEEFSNRSMELPDRLLIGAIDSHVHAGPVLKSNPGHKDPIELALEARAAGMKSLVYYDVFGWASGTSWMVNRHVEGIKTYGGYLMNSCHNGINPRSVLTALEIGDGCRFISFGSHCTYHSAKYESTLVNGELIPFEDAYPKFKEEELSRAVRIGLNDPITKELDEVLQMIASYKDVYLNVGHVSQEEALRLVELARQRKIEKILIPHPVRSGMSIETQKQLASEGIFLEACLVDVMYPDVPRTHYYVEKEYMDCHCLVPKSERTSIPAWLDIIREVGSNQIVLGTDYGIRAAPSCVQGMRTLITLLLDYEFSVEDIIKMTSENPARLIGIED